MSRNRIKSTLLALLLSLAMVVTYLPASMIAYAGNEDIDDTAIELNTDADDDVIVDDVQNVDGVSDEESAPVAAPETGDEEGDVDFEEEDLTSSEEPAEADSEPVEEASPKLGATRDAKADGLTVFAFTSDTHNQSGNVAATRIGTWLDMAEWDHITANRCLRPFFRAVHPIFKDDIFGIRIVKQRKLHRESVIDI